MTKFCWKDRGSDFICPELGIHFGAWLRGFFLLAPTRNSEFGQDCCSSCDLKAFEKPVKNPIHQIIKLSSALHFLQDVSSDLSMPA